MKEILKTFIYGVIPVVVIGGILQLLITYKVARDIGWVILILGLIYLLGSIIREVTKK